MGFLDKFKKTAEPELPLKSGTIDKTPSFIMAIPKDDSLLDDQDALLERLLKMDGIEVISKKYTEGFEIALKYKDAEYTFEVRVDDFELPELFRVGHDFTEKEIEVMESAKRGLISRMVFSENNGDSFHLQIKLLCAMIDDPAGIVDYSSERMLAGRWAKLAAKSDVPPSPEYLYVIQCVSGKKDDVWIHTHGLNRCGGIELEILQSDKEHYGDQGNLVTAIASRIISNSEFIEEYEPLYVAHLSQDTAVVATWISWERALKKYPKDILGGAEDRADGHNENTGVLYVYDSEDDCDNRRLSHIGIYNELLANNPIMMLTSEETQRMKRLAIERIDFMKQLFESRKSSEDMVVLIKVGLEPDEEYRDGDMKEHIWFELKEINDGSFKAELTQEPYYVATLHEGSVCEFRWSEITDWVVMTPETRITPDSVYRLTE